MSVITTLKCSQHHIYFEACILFYSVVKNCTSYWGKIYSQTTGFRFLRFLRNYPKRQTGNLHLSSYEYDEYEKSISNIVDFIGGILT